MSRTLTPANILPVEGVNINYTASAVSNKHPTVVLIHGFGASLETWDDIYPLLSKHFSVIRMDLKGSGFSSKPRDTAYSPNDQARLLLAFLAQLNETNVVLVGHSLGGGVALLTYFESVLSNNSISVKGLVLLDSAGYSRTLPFFVSAVRNPITRFISRLMPPHYRARFVLNRIIKVNERITDERVHRYAFFLNKPGNQFALYQTAKQIIPHNVLDLTASIKTIQIPTLIIWGENDPVIALDDGRRFEQDIVGSKLVVLNATGHIPHEERPGETFDALNNFLESLR